MQVEEVHVDICIQCKKRPLEDKRIVCSCGSPVCEGCITVHLPSHENHERQKSWITTTTAKIESRWNWICGKIQSLTDSTSRTTQFQNDQATKWFGIHVEEGEGESGRVTQLVETPRFSCLAELSMYHKGKSPRRQFPSITSFVGETGAGKSTLIRSLIFQVAGSDFDKLEAPVPGAHSGDAICIPTTGEVNLYPDPQTFGTSAPQFLVDCEGMLGGEPDAAQHQKEWINHGRRYRLAPKGGKAIDRRTAVMSIYPRFLYLFSDVICMVTRNQKTWADSAVKLLEWSRVGAHHTVNQFALPALIIILNGPAIENEAWVSSDRDAATRDFFTSVEREINTDEVLREMAKKHGDKTMRDLLYRNFSSVYVHYIPLEGYKTLGNSGVIMLQIERLSQRIRKDTERVQRERANTRTRFDARELGSVFDYAFKHLASGSDEPFDMSQCQQQMSLPTTVEGHFAEFLGRCMLNHVEDNFDVAAEVLGSCIVRHSLKSRGSDLLHPLTLFGTEFREVCRRALNQFLDNSQPCAYVHPETGEACVNVRAGHAKGHQAGGGHVLAEGNYVDGLIDADRFLGLIGSSIDKVLKRIDKNSDSDMEARRLLAATLHRNNLMSFPNRSFWEASFTLGWIDAFNKRFGHISGARLTVRASVCYACLFGRPEYTLPCGHVICFDCIREFDQSSPDNRYPGIAVHQDCVLCGSTDEREGKWPYRVEYRPDLSGVRVLSLDGGGVRGIIPLTILQRLEDLVNLDGPFGELFDLIVGTSAGGIIALGLGVHNFSTERCTKNFWSLCMNGFTPRPGTKNAWFGWIARLFASSIYETERLELCLRDAFGPKKLFGHCGNTSRVAVTTTVDSECRLLANYNWGNGKRYLNSNIYTWHAARCTSAAPMYFEPSLHDGTQCRDGGLMVNNPVQLAVNEAKSIWGREIVFDLIATLGCGQAENPQPRPDSIWILPSWLVSLFTIFTATMNGNAGWQKFSENVDKPLLDRCSRLNVKFPGDAEPELDDTSKTLDLEILAKSAKFHYNPPGGPFSPTLGAVSQDSLKVLADRLRASLFFFELRSLIRHDDVFIVEGWVCCRLSPERKSYESLLAATSHFRVKGQTIKIPPSREGARLKVDVSFQQQALEDSEPIRIDAQIQGGSLATISGFPMTLKMLTTYWETKYF